VIVLLLLILFFFIALSLAGRVANPSKKKRVKLNIEDIGKKIERYSMQMKKRILFKKTYSKIMKNQKKKEKKEEKGNIHSPVVFVIDFNGDVKASQVSELRDEITIVLQVADPKKDEVVVRLESRGGVVHGYGLAASQLKRIRDRKIPLTICVDKVAASGGYMMACIAHRIIAAPFAIVGSIGVVSSVPNLHRFLKSKDIDYEEMTAGEFKRTVSLFGEISEKGRQKHLKDIEDIHQLFKDHVRGNRPSLDIDKVSTGEYWYGVRALKLGLIDEILSSDDYISQLIQNRKKVYGISLKTEKNLVEKFSHQAQAFFSHQKKWNTQPYDLPNSEFLPPDHII